MKLLVVDDDPDFRSVVLTNAPDWLEVCACEGSADAMEHMSRSGSHAPDFAIVDLNLEPFLAPGPRQEGPALARWLSDRKQSPCLILVSVDALESLAGPGRGPYVGFLRKPINLARLFRFLESYRRLFGQE